MLWSTDEVHFRRLDGVVGDRDVSLLVADYDSRFRVIIMSLLRDTLFNRCEVRLCVYAQCRRRV